ncbi:MAG: hypothetical protein C6H99_00370 [Epsilonproteobacteria bacterium]|nr:hypothetical protein [Campylobacterota bacterium]NPA63812.1 hypothetical protein [Campylobacterota bacterium]
MVRGAFSLLEFIFALVIIGFALLSIPNIFTQSSQAIQETIKQEAVFQGFRTISAILTYRWDEKSVVGSDDNRSYILDVTNGDDELNRTATQTRKGHFNTKRRTFFDTTTYATTSLGLEPGETTQDDIDDFNNNQDTITLTPGERLLSTTLKQKVYYISDSADYSATSLSLKIDTSSATPSTNIKMIQVTITDDKNTTIALLRAFTCNIGEPTQLDPKQVP